MASKASRHSCWCESAQLFHFCVSTALSEDEELLPRAEYEAAFRDDMAALQATGPNSTARLNLLTDDEDVAAHIHKDATDKFLMAVKAGHEVCTCYFLEQADCGRVELALDAVDHKELKALLCTRLSAAAQQQVVKALGTTASLGVSKEELNDILP